MKQSKHLFLTRFAPSLWLGVLLTLLSGSVWGQGLLPAITSIRLSGNTLNIQATNFPSGPWP